VLGTDKQSLSDRNSALSKFFYQKLTASSFIALASGICSLAWDTTWTERKDHDDICWYFAKLSADI